MEYMIAAATFFFGGFLGWMLGSHNAAQTRKVVADVEAGKIGQAVKDATTNHPPGSAA